MSEHRTHFTDANAAGGVPADLTARLRALRDALLTGLVERDEAIRLALLGALSGEHLLLIGPPGTAKSVLARRLHLAFKDAAYFERLLTKFSVPEELFGPLSIKALELDMYQRQTERYLPTAAIAFLDEIFKANSAILNALLTLLNEREFDNGTRREKTPLISVVGASNELPDGEELDALFDRFLLRLHVGYVSDDGFESLLDLRGDASPQIDPALRLTTEDILAVQAASSAVTVPTDVFALLRSWRRWCADQSIEVSDRRWRKVVKLLQVSALSNGRNVVSVWDAWLLQHCLWNEPEQRQSVYQWYAERVGASAAMDPSRLTKIVVSWEGKLKRDQQAQGQQRDSTGRLLYQTAKGSATTKGKGPVQQQRDGKPLYVSQSGWRTGGHYDEAEVEPKNSGKGYVVEELNAMKLIENGRWVAFNGWEKRASYLSSASSWLTAPGTLAPHMGTAQQKPEYIAATLSQLDALKDNIEAYRGQVIDHIAEMTTTIRSHLWVAVEFIRPAATTLNANLASVNSLLARLAHARQGFEVLPVEPAEAVLDESSADDDGQAAE